MGEVTILDRPVGPEELALIEASGWTAFPPRLPERPISNPVTIEDHAARISRNWTVRDDGSASVTRFAVDPGIAGRCPVRRVGAGHAEELRVPAEELAESSRNIVGRIEVIAADPAEAGEPCCRRSERLPKPTMHPGVT